MGNESAIWIEYISICTGVADANICVMELDCEIAYVCAITWHNLDTHALSLSHSCFLFNIHHHTRLQTF